jgi:hypothetical protein
MEGILRVNQQLEEILFDGQGRFPEPRVQSLPEMVCGDAEIMGAAVHPCGTCCKSSGSCESQTVAAMDAPLVEPRVAAMDAPLAEPRH